MQYAIFYIRVYRKKQRIMCWELAEFAAGKVMLLKLWDQRDIYHSPLGTLSHKGAGREQSGAILWSL